MSTPRKEVIGRMAEKAADLASTTGVSYREAFDAMFNASGLIAEARAEVSEDYAEVCRVAQVRLERITQLLDENRQLKEDHDGHRFDPNCRRCSELARELSR